MRDFMALGIDRFIVSGHLECRRAGRIEDRWAIPDFTFLWRSFWLAGALSDGIFPARYFSMVQLGGDRLARLFDHR